LKVSTIKCLILFNLIVMMVMGWCRQCRTRFQCTCHCCCCWWGMLYYYSLTFNIVSWFWISPSGKYNDVGLHPDSF